ncbi:MAG: hypothetical protein HZB79_07070 [Deltaproteobacteria bacterium]|nr:hypothetical protein [Deltaproteobacteria bacterium]
MEHTKHMEKDIFAEVMKKIQFLTASQQKFLQEMLVSRKKVSAVSKKKILKKSFGIWANRKDIKNNIEYINEIRK